MVSQPAEKTQGLQDGDQDLNRSMSNMIIKCGFYSSLEAFIAWKSYTEQKAWYLLEIKYCIQTKNKPKHTSLALMFPWKTFNIPLHKRFFWWEFFFRSFGPCSHSSRIRLSVLVIWATFTNSSVFYGYNIFKYIIYSDLLKNGSPVNEDLMDATRFDSRRVKGDPTFQFYGRRHLCYYLVTVCMVTGMRIQAWLPLNVHTDSIQDGTLRDSHL